MLKTIVKMVISFPLAVMIVITGGQPVWVWALVAYLSFLIITGLKNAFSKNTSNVAYEMVVNTFPDQDLLLRSMASAKFFNVLWHGISFGIFFLILNSVVPAWVLYLCAANTIVHANATNSILNNITNMIEEKNDTTNQTSE